MKGGDQSAMTVLETAQAYLSRYGWQAIPVPHKAKNPGFKGWQALRLSEEDLPRYFNGHPQNLGVLLGEPSGGLLDVDLDCTEALRLARCFLPETLTFGRESKPESHWLYTAEPLEMLPETTKYQLHRTDERGRRKAETLVELRSTGGQTLFPPSVHPSGEPIRFASRRVPLRTSGKRLAVAVRNLAVACLFLRSWPVTAGTRQDCALALAGALLRSGFTQEDAEEFILHVARCAGDEECGRRANAVVHAAMRIKNGSNAWGWPKVAELFGEDVAKQARAWLGIADSPPREGRDAPEMGEAPALPERAYALLPDTLQEAVGYFDTWYKRDVFLTALLGALSSALPNVRFLYGQQYQSPHLYFFVLARAASGKGVMTHAFRWLDAADAYLRHEWMQDHVAWQEQKDSYERAKRSRKDAPLEADPPGPEPPERCLKAGANTTAAALGERLAANPHGIFIGATEADTLTSSNRREHGNFSHIVRQAFHHEEAQIDRKTESTLRIKHPRLALVLSGTPKQFPRFMEGGVEDGLFSRFGVYSFEAPAVFAPQWATAQDARLETFTQEAGERVLRLYKLLRGRDGPLYFDVPTHLQEQVTSRFKALHDTLAAEGAFDLVPSVRRGVVLTLRMAAVLTLWRQFEEGKPLGTARNVVATERDIEAAVALGLVYVEHALREALRMEPELGALPDTENVGGACRMTGRQRQFFDALPMAFSTGEAEALAGSLDVPRSTLFHWLGRWTEATLLEKPGQGAYRKQQAGRSGESRLGLLDALDFRAGAPNSANSELDGALDTPGLPVDIAPDESNLGSNVLSFVQAEICSECTVSAESPKVQPGPITVLAVGQRVETARGMGTVVELPGPRQKVKVALDALADTPIPVRAFDAADLFSVTEISTE